MKVLRPDPAEYVEDFGCGPIRSVNVLCGALGLAKDYGLGLGEVYRLAMGAASVRDFDRLIDERADEIRNAVFDRDGDRCRYCGNADGHLVIDHVFPDGSGIENLLTSCAACFFGKEEWGA